MGTSPKLATEAICQIRKTIFSRRAVLDILPLTASNLDPDYRRAEST